MAEQKQWYTSEVNCLLEKLDHKCSTLYLSRVLYVYTVVKKLMDLCEDTENCKSYEAKNLIEKEMKSIVDELWHYEVYDDRFKDLFDKGGK